MLRTSLKFIKFCFSVLIVLLICQSKALSQAVIQPLDGSDYIFNENKDTDGSAYMFDDFEKGSLVNVDGRIIENLNLNYNAETEFMVAKLTDGSYLQLNRYYYKRAHFNNQNFINLSAYGGSGFAKIIYDGLSYKLFEKTKAKRSRADSNKYNEVKSYYKIRKTKVHLLLVENELNAIKRKEKDLYSFFPKNEIKSFIKKEKLKLKKDDDIIQFLKHFDELD